MLVLTHGEKWGGGAYVINGYAEKGRVYSGMYINIQIGAVALRLALNRPKPKNKPFFLWKRAVPSMRKSRSFP